MNKLKVQMRDIPDKNIDKSDVKNVVVVIIIFAVVGDVSIAAIAGFCS